MYKRQTRAQRGICRSIHQTLPNAKTPSLQVLDPFPPPGPCHDNLQRPLYSSRWLRWIPSPDPPPLHRATTAFPLPPEPGTPRVPGIAVGRAHIFQVALRKGLRARRRETPVPSLRQWWLRIVKEPRGSRLGFRRWRLRLADVDGQEPESSIAFVAASSRASGIAVRSFNDHWSGRNRGRRRLGMLRYALALAPIVRLSHGTAVRFGLREGQCANRRQGRKIEVGSCVVNGRSSR